jgi:hypothetical protein
MTSFQVPLVPKLGRTPPPLTGEIMEISEISELLARGLLKSILGLLDQIFKLGFLNQDNHAFSLGSEPKDLKIE